MFGQVDNIPGFEPNLHCSVETPGGKVLEIGNGFPHSLFLPDFDILFGSHDALSPLIPLDNAVESGPPAPTRVALFMKGVHLPFQLQKSSPFHVMH